MTTVLALALYSHRKDGDTRWSSAFTSSFAARPARRTAGPSSAWPLCTVSQKTSHLWLAITLTHMNGFWYFLAEMLPIK